MLGLHVQTNGPIPSFSSKLIALYFRHDIIRPMIVDFHTHVYPEHVAATTLESVRERAGINSYTGGTVRGLLDSMLAAEIDLSVVSRIATKPEQVEPINRWLQEIQQPGILPVATIHPDLSMNPELIPSLKAQGFKGLKLHPDYQGFFVDQISMYPMYEAVQAEHMFALFHAGVDRGLPNPVHSTPERLAKLHRQFPHLRIIAAHMGGEGMYDETEQYLLGSAVYLDTSFVLQKMPLNTVKRFFGTHPVERLLFGTDSPWTDQKQELDYFLSLPFLTEEAKERIAGGNAAGLMDLA